MNAPQAGRLRTRQRPATVVLAPSDAPQAGRLRTRQRPATVGAGAQPGEAVQPIDYPAGDLPGAGSEGARVHYQIVAEAYRDLERASARLQLIERVAGLFRETPGELLPTVALLCQG